MQDILYIAILVAFFALMGVFVKACERIIGPDIEGEKLDSADAGAASRAPAGRAA